MTWQLILLIAVLANSFSLILGKYVLNDDKCDPVSVVIVYQFLSGIFILLSLPFIGFGAVSLTGVLPFFIISPILYLVSNILRFKALKVTDSSKYMVILQTGTIWTIILAVIFLGESFSLKQLLGVLLVVFGVVLVSQMSFKKFEFKKAELLIIITAFISALAFISDAFVLRQMDASLFAAYAFIVPGVLTATIFPDSFLKSKNLFNKRNLVPLFSSTILTAVTVVAIYRAYQLGRNAAVITPLLQTSTILVVLLGIFILKEKDNLFRKILAAIISMIGVILISL